MDSDEYFDSIDYSIDDLKLFNIYKKTTGSVNSWSEPKASDFIIRGPLYLDNFSSRKKFKEKSAESPYKVINVAMLNSEKRIEHSVTDINDVRKYMNIYNSLDSEIPRFVVINFQFPSMSLFTKTEHTLVQNIFQLRSDYKIGSDPKLEKRIMRFVNSSTKEKNKQFKFICQIVEGPPIAKKSLKTLGVESPVKLGLKLKTYYNSGHSNSQNYENYEPNYLEINVDVGSSYIARMVKGTVFEYIDKLILNCGFLFEGQTKEELPERMLFKVSYNKSDPNKIIKYINKNGDIVSEKTW